MTTKEKAIEQLERISSRFASIGETEDYTDVAIQALEQTRWIPCSERLPKNYDEVLISTGFVTSIGWFDADNNTWRLNDDYVMGVVAWMPLPESYYEAEMDEEVEKQKAQSERVNCENTKCENCVNHHYCDYER